LARQAQVTSRQVASQEALVTTPEHWEKGGNLMVLQMVQAWALVAPLQVAAGQEGEPATLHASPSSLVLLRD